MQIKRKTFMAFVSVIATFIAMSALLALFFSHFWQTTHPPTGDAPELSEKELGIVDNGEGATPP